jgi:hypothetical protein
MSKIPNIFNQNPIVVSQGLHNQGWNNKNYNVAIDFAYIGGLTCPFDGCEIITYPNSFPQNVRQSYFGLKLPDGSVIVVVHSKPVKMGKINKGEVFAICMWHHYHLFILVNGQPDCILSYLDRSTPMYSEPNLYASIGGKNHPDGKWESYPDKQLNIGNQPKPIPQPPVQQNIYTVKIGDNLWNIAKSQKLLTNDTEIANYVSKIAKANNINPSLIMVGQKIILP